MKISRVIRVVIVIFATLAVSISAQAKAVIPNRNVIVYMSRYSTVKGSSNKVPVSAMRAMDQVSDWNEPGTYVKFTTPTSAYSGYHRFFLPKTILPKNVKALNLAVNYRTPAMAKQVWNWSAYDWTLKRWVVIGKNSAAQNNWTWNYVKFKFPGTLPRFIHPISREVRIRLTSSNANGDASIDVEDLIVTIAGSLPEALPASGGVSPFTRVNEMRRGMNLGDALEAPNEGEWGVTLQESYFQAIKDAGFDFVRIPVKWSGHSATVSPYTIDPVFLARVDWAVDTALSKGLMVVLDMHHYDELAISPWTQRPRLLGIWKQLAAHYQNYPDTLMFEPVSEPNGMFDVVSWNAMLPEIIRTIRQTNSTRIIVVGSAYWNNPEWLKTLELPKDTYLLPTAHYYNPFEFTHQGAGWVGGSDAWLGTQWDGTTENKKSVMNDLDKIAAWGAMHNLPILIGEFGAYEKADYDDRVRWTDFVARQAEARGMAWSYWEFAEGFGAYDPLTDTWRPELRDALIPPAPPAASYTFPAQVSSWQIQYSGAINTSANYDVYNLDLFDTPAATIADLHSRNIFAMCYFSAGSYENWRSDQSQFPTIVRGANLDGWPGEKWLDIRRVDLLAPIMTARLDLAVEKGCDGVDPDNVDGYANSSGFALTAQNQINYNHFLAHAAHARGLSIGLKNDLNQISRLVGDFDWALNEQCFYYNECNLLQPFIDAGKPVFNIEYELRTSSFCARANALNFNSLRKDMDLTAFREPCR